MKPIPSTQVHVQLFKHMEKKDNQTENSQIKLSESEFKSVLFRLERICSFKSFQLC